MLIVSGLRYLRRGPDIILQQQKSEVSLKHDALGGANLHTTVIGWENVTVGVVEDPNAPRGGHDLEDK